MTSEKQWQEHLAGRAHQIQFQAFIGDGGGSGDAGSSSGGDTGFVLSPGSGSFVPSGFITGGAPAPAQGAHAPATGGSPAGCCAICARIGKVSACRHVNFECERPGGALAPGAVDQVME